MASRQAAAVERAQPQQRRAPPLTPPRWSAAAAATVPRGEPAATTLGSGLLENAVVQMMLDKQQGVFRRSL